jgi:two-component system sensor histidine kinase KdpD
VALVTMGDTGSVQRGLLRVYLGSAPGVGKTYRMLDEGWRRKQRGTDVVVAYVETHGRSLTVAQLRDLEVVPRITREYRGARLEEMDLEAVLARHPEVALVDELAHTNVAGSTHEKRWQDVDALLDAGIDVITTVNIQHLESVNDVVEKITGIRQQETIPDAVVRRAEQIEIVDVTPEALRRRMAHGNIYAADKIDASLSNYFRVGNLSALRELALLWLADRVEDSLQRYLDDHAINQTWETRERLIVGVTGTPTDESLLRRAARIASRTGAELFAVHVVKADDIRHTPTDTSIARELAEEFAGIFQEVVDDDVAIALVSFARSERGTQIVLGASRPRPLWRRTTGVVEKILHHASDLDVHIIAVGGERPAHVHPRRQRAPVSWTRLLLAIMAAAIVLPILTILMAEVRSSLSLSTVFLVYLVAVLALTTWSGAIVGVVAAVAASALENFYFVKPLHTLVVARPDDVVALVAFLVFAVTASVLVTRFAQRSLEADRARAEAEILAEAAVSFAASHEDLLPLLDSLRNVFAATSVAILVFREGQWSTDLVSGDLSTEESLGNSFDIDEDHRLVVTGATLNEQDHQLVGAFAGRMAVSLRSQVIAHDASQLQEIAEAESLRLALFRTASKELLGPLEKMQANISLLSGSHELRSLDERKAVLSGVEAQVRQLTRLVVNIIDAGRLEAGEVVAVIRPLQLDDVVNSALLGVDTKGRAVERIMASDVPGLQSDPILIQRVIANVVSNACRFSPLDQPVRLTAGVVGHFVELLVVDRGPGMSEEKRDVVLAPFDRLSGEQLNAGLNLTVASGFMQLLGGRLHFEDTPGGGLTVAIELPLDGPSSDVMSTAATDHVEK